MSILIIARHGNTFEKGEEPRRVGLHTDLPLTEEGRAQARRLGRWLKENGLLPDRVFTSELRRTKDTALEALSAAGLNLTPQADPFLNEIDYGPDENQPESEVIARIGAQALKDWDERSIVPPGWDANPVQITASWQDFAARINGVTLAVTSNGIARFALPLAVNNRDFPPKIATGAVCVLRSDGSGWSIEIWNHRP